MTAGRALLLASRSQQSQLVSPPQGNSTHCSRGTEQKAETDRVPGGVEKIIAFDGGMGDTWRIINNRKKMCHIFFFKFKAISASLSPCPNTTMFPPFPP